MCQYAVIELDQEYTKEELELKVKQFAIDQLAEEDQHTNPIRFEDPKDYIYSQDTLETVRTLGKSITIPKEEYELMKGMDVYNRMNAA